MGAHLHAEVVVLEGVGDALGDLHGVLADAGLLRDDEEGSADGDGRGARARGDTHGGRVALARAERRRHHVGGHLVRKPVRVRMPVPDHALSVAKDTSQKATHSRPAFLTGIDEGISNFKNHRLIALFARVFPQLADYCSVPGSPIDEHPTDNTRVSFEWRVVLRVQRSLYTRVFWWLPPGLLTTVGRDEARGCRAGGYRGRYFFPHRQGTTRGPSETAAKRERPGIVAPSPSEKR